MKTQMNGHVTTSLHTIDLPYLLLSGAHAIAFTNAIQLGVRVIQVQVGQKT